MATKIQEFLIGTAAGWIKPNAPVERIARRNLSSHRAWGMRYRTEGSPERELSLRTGFK
jgi:hypothetical protein